MADGGSRKSCSLQACSALTSHQPIACEGQDKVLSMPDQHLLISEGTCGSIVTLAQ